MNQEPGIGPDQAPRQSSPNTGEEENGLVLDTNDVNDGLMYPEVAEAVQVTLNPVPEPVTFRVRIENVSSPGTLQPSDGSMQAVPISPGVWVVHVQDTPIFSAGELEIRQGLEGVAEDGRVAQLASTIVNQPGVLSAGFFDTPVGAAHPVQAIGPGEAFEFEVMARPPGYLRDGTGAALVAIGVASLSFAAMFVASNDWFFTSAEMGIPLFDEEGNPIRGDVTDQIRLWDAGTEMNEEPGVGQNQAPRQAGQTPARRKSKSSARLMTFGLGSVRKALVPSAISLLLR